MNEMEEDIIYIEDGEIRRIVNEELDKRIGTEERYHVTESYPQWNVYDRGTRKVVGTFEDEISANHICNLLNEDLKKLETEINLDLQNDQMDITKVIAYNFYPTQTELLSIFREISAIQDALNCQNQL